MHDRHTKNSYLEKWVTNKLGLIKKESENKAQSSNQLYSKPSDTAGWVFISCGVVIPLPLQCFWLCTSFIEKCHVCFSYEGLNKWKHVDATQGKEI